MCLGDLLRLVEDVSEDLDQLQVACQLLVLLDRNAFTQERVVLLRIRHEEDKVLEQFDRTSAL